MPSELDTTHGTEKSVISYEQIRQAVINALVLDQDGDVNLTQICKNAGKEVWSWTKSKGCKDILSELQAEPSNEGSLIKTKKGGNYKEAHLLARKAFCSDTGIEYLGADVTSLETKTEYLKWLRTFKSKELV